MPAIPYRVLVPVLLGNVGELLNIRNDIEKKRRPGGFGLLSKLSSTNSYLLYEILQVPTIERIGRFDEVSEDAG